MLSSRTALIICWISTVRKKSTRWSSFRRRHELLDEFAPNLYCLEAELAGKARAFKCLIFIPPGLVSEFTHEGTQFSVNGKRGDTAGRRPAA